MLSLSCSSQEWKVDERVGTEGPKGEAKLTGGSAGGGRDSPASQQPLGSFPTGSPARPGG